MTYVVLWSAIRFPWVPDEEGGLEPDPRQDRDAVYGPFDDHASASAFAERLPAGETHEWPAVVLVEDPVTRLAAGR